MKKQILLALSIFLSIAPTTVIGDEKKMDSPSAKIVTTSSGLRYRDDKVGTGETANPGKTVSVHYTGWLDNNGEPGTKFDSSRERSTPFEFRLGAGQVIAGWDEGVSGMKVGGIRRLIIPSKLGYGERGAGHIIKPGDGLIFDVELLAVK
jgi:FKBP-type peptidyl-prolyl cis-trans isomerase